MIRLTISVLLLVTTLAEARPFKASVTIPKDRFVAIHGPITDLTPHIQKVRALASKSNRAIYLDIDSPGGGILTMFAFVQVMEEAKGLGIPFICVVRSLAASAAFSILNECDVRYAFSASLLLWHPGSGFLMQQIGAEELERLMIQLKTLDAHIVRRLKSNLKIDDEVFDRHFRAETFHTPESLNELSPNYMRVLRRVTYTGATK